MSRMIDIKEELEVIMEHHPEVTAEAYNLLRRIERDTQALRPRSEEDILRLLRQYDSDINALYNSGGED